MKTPTTPCLDLDLGELLTIIEKPTLAEEDRAKLRAVVGAYAVVTQQIDAKRMTIARLRKILFGASTEKTSGLGTKPSEPGASAPGDPTTDGHSAATAGQAAPDGSGGPPVKPKRKGHGRNGAARYRGADRVVVSHPSLHPGDRCPVCHHGKLYTMCTPAVRVRVRGQAPMAATVYEHGRLRCNPCGAIVEAPAPEAAGEDKYDETVPAMIGMLRFGSGMPFNRIDRLQSS